ncbi:MAG: hypothetical protein EA397_12215 [Deltaproteobacteria bacterium]|nr:MAG: hypothetical protein EA397_12215 [Deltaproteobacteria bacterium]
MPRPLTHVEGSIAVLWLSCAFLAAAIVLAWPRPTDGAREHRVGQGVLIALAALSVLVTSGTAYAEPTGLLRRALRWLAFPVSIASLGFGFAWIGRVHRLSNRRRFAHLADLAGFVLPTLWAASQLIGGYPGPALQIPGAAAWVVGAAALAGLFWSPRSP